MMSLKPRKCSGFALLELLMVFIIIGALASIAIPNYSGYKAKARSAQCEANRHNIELEEKAYFSIHDKPNLTIDNKYACLSGGIYVWLASDVEDPDYPKIGCSIHDAGLDKTSPVPTEPGYMKSEPKKQKKPKEPKKSKK